MDICRDAQLDRKTKKMEPISAVAMSPVFQEKKYIHPCIRNKTIDNQKDDHLKKKKYD